MKPARFLHVILASIVGTTGVGADALRLQVPLACEPGRTCFVQYHVDHDPSSGARDYTGGPRTYDHHDGTDFRLQSLVAEAGPLGTVRAAAGGTVIRVRNDAPDVSVRETGLSEVAGVECGNGLVIAHADSYETQYCHLAKGSVKVLPGEAVTAGQDIGHAGLSGATEFPHLHFTVRRAGRTVDPFAPNGPPPGGGEDSLWDETARAALAYRAGTVLNSGFSDGPVTMAAVEAEQIKVPHAQADALVAWVRAIGLDTGDVQTLVVRSPDGRILAESRLPPLAKPRAQSLVFAGKKRPPDGWPAGTYVAQYQVLRGGHRVLDRTFAATLPFGPP